MTTVGHQIWSLANEWIGTPYRHQASLKGVGCDCLGLLRGVWREYYGAEPEMPIPYERDWAERSGVDRLLEAAHRHFGTQYLLSEAQLGDVVIFRWRQGYAAKHVGIIGPDNRFIHAYEQASVICSALVPTWQRKIAGIFRFPER